MAMLENERRRAAEWACFYHSYSEAALIYEVQAAIASVLFGYGSRWGALPRLLRGRFAECPDAPTMMRIFPSWKDQDHNDCFKSVGLCGTTNLLDGSQPEAPPTAVFLNGYSVGCPGAAALTEGVLTTCGISPAQAKKSTAKIIALADGFGLGVTKGGSRPGHMLQIFMQRHLVDKYVYASFAMGVPDPSRHPLSANMNGGGKVSGQIRMVVHPSAFMFKSKVRCYTYSADQRFHDNRAKFQEALVEELRNVLGDPKLREAAARGVFGGALPAWYRAVDMRSGAERARRRDSKSSAAAGVVAAPG